MRIQSPVVVIYPLVVDAVNPYAARCMDNLFVVHDNTYMTYISFGIVKKSQVTRLCFIDKHNLLSFAGLLRRISGQLNAHHLKNQLGQSRTVNPEQGFTTP
jgi:hypothetical protein